MATGAATVVAAGGLVRFAFEYRRRAGLPFRRPVDESPAGLGLPCETVAVPGESGPLPAWFIPAEPVEPVVGERGESDAAPERRPAVAIVHGWESNRGRSLRQATFLHAAGFHCLVFDVRGHGDNPPETLPISAAEFGADAAAAARYLAARADVSTVGVVGHSMGGAGALIAAAREPCIGAVVVVSAPSDAVSVTRSAFKLAELRVPSLFASPLAWFTAWLFLRPRHHSIADASATAAATRYKGPLLVAQGAEDRAVPVAQLRAIAGAAAASRPPGGAPVQTLVLPGVGHRWLYEAPAYRQTVAAFLARALGGPVSPEEAARRAAECRVSRPPDAIQGFGASGRLVSTAVVPPVQSETSAP